MAVADSVVNEDAPDGDTIRTNALNDRMGVDTTSMDSLELAIYRHNKAIDDFIRKCEMESRVILDEIIHLSYHGLSIRELQRIAEQLKAGGKNE